MFDAAADEPGLVRIGQSVRVTNATTAFDVVFVVQLSTICAGNAQDVVETVKTWAKAVSNHDKSAYRFEPLHVHCDVSLLNACRFALVTFGGSEPFGAPRVITSDGGKVLVEADRLAFHSSSR